MQLKIHNGVCIRGNESRVIVSSLPKESFFVKVKEMQNVCINQDNPVNLEDFQETEESRERSKRVFFSTFRNSRGGTKEPPSDSGRIRSGPRSVHAEIWKRPMLPLTQCGGYVCRE